MVFTSTIFVFLFLPAVLLLYYGMPKKWRSIQYRNMVLLLMSLFFYAWGEPAFVFVMLFYIFLNWLIALKISKSEKKTAKAWLSVIVILDVLLIFIFKYLSFLLQNVGALFDTTTEINIALPIGISFFTFQIMSYVFDVYYGKVQVQKNLLKVALYISLFPQLIAGPIVQYSTVEKEINDRTETRENFADGVIRFVYGMAKKVLIANYVAIVADNYFSIVPSSLSVTSAWLGAIAYALQIYFDFSGYSDMAIGLGKMFGFHFNENFNYPYAATSITDFWRRWHISLSSWFRDYVYIPLGGSRCSKARSVFNLTVVWVLTGIWHGANWTFVLWGVYYLVLLLIERGLKLAKREHGIIGRTLLRVPTLAFIIIGWVLFRAETVGKAGQYIGAMLGANGVFNDATFLYNIKNGWTVLLPAVILAFPVIRRLSSAYRDKIAKDKPALQVTGQIVESVVVLAVLFLSVTLIVQSTYNPFIYFNF